MRVELGIKGAGIVGEDFVIDDSTGGGAGNLPAALVELA